VRGTIPQHLPDIGIDHRHTGLPGLQLPVGQIEAYRHARQQGPVGHLLVDGRHWLRDCRVGKQPVQREIVIHLREGLAHQRQPR
jgi:hypothetical protein